MTEEQKELLIEKLKTFFEPKLESLTNKFENDIKSIEEIKYHIYDNIIIPYREIAPKEKENELKKEKELKKDEIKIEEKKKEEKKSEKKKEEKKVEEKKKEEKKTGDLKESKTNLSKTIKNDNLNLAKTPMKANRKRELDFKGKTEVLPKKSRVFSGKTHKPELNTTFHKDKPKNKDNITLTEANKKTERNKSTKTLINKNDKDKEEKKEAKKSKGISATAYKPSATKRFTARKKTIDKKGKHDKKGKEIKNDIKNVNIKNKKEKKEEKKEEIKEEKKIDINYKGLNQIPEDFKNKNALFNIYLMLKGKYLNNKENCKLILSNPIIYKNFGSNIKFLLNDKIKELKSKISELETFLNKYDDLPNIVSSIFQPSKAAIKSMMFVTKEEIENLIKKGNIPKEFIGIFKIILYILDIEFDENLQNEDLLQFFISEVLVKPNKKNLMIVVNDFFGKNKDLDLKKEKMDKIENLIKSDDINLSITDIAKKNRIISYCTFLIKEYHDYINNKTSDGIPHYELKDKDKKLKEYKYKLALIENNGIPPKIEEKKEEIKEVKEEGKETKEEIKETKDENKEKKEDDNKQIIENIEKKEENENETKKESNENKVISEEIKNQENIEIKEDKKEENQNPPVENVKVEEQNEKKE